MELLWKMKPILVIVVVAVAAATALFGRSFMRHRALVVIVIVIIIANMLYKGRSARSLGLLGNCRPCTLIVDLAPKLHDGAARPVGPLKERTACRRRARRHEGSDKMAWHGRKRMRRRGNPLLPPAWNAILLREKAPLVAKSGATDKSM